MKVEEKKVTDTDRNEWKCVKILVVDECSFCSQGQLERLDKRLRRLRSIPDVPYGGLHIIFIGNLHQLVPFDGDSLYSKYCIHWHDLINTSIFLENDHRFVDDPEYGQMVERFSNGTVTKADISLINSRLLNDKNGNGGNIDLPNGNTSDLYYACSTNAERNSITTSLFKNYIQNTHPVNDENVDLTQVPKNVIIIESAIYDKNNERCSVSFESNVYNKCGDADIQTSHNKRIDPVLKFYSGVPLMLIDNLHLKEGRGNGTKCFGLSIQLKQDCDVHCKVWDGILIHTVSVLDVDYMICETVPNNKNEKAKLFQLKPEKDSVVINMKICNMKHQLSAKIIQFK